MLFPGQNTTRALERTAQYSISALRIVGQLLERMMSLASPERRALRVDLQPSTYLPLLMTKPSLLLMFSVPTFFTITINLFIKIIFLILINDQFLPLPSFKILKALFLHLEFFFVVKFMQYQNYYLMRKKSRQGQAYIFPKIQSTVITTPPVAQPMNSLEKFQMQLADTKESALVNFRVNRRYSRAVTLGEEESSLAHGIKEVSRQLSDLKRQIRSRKTSKQDAQNFRLGRILTQVEDSMLRNRSMPPQMIHQPPMYVPVPFPMYMPPTNFGGYQNQSQSFYRKTYRKKTTTTRFNRGKKNVKKWRKIGNCILFYFYLKRFCRLVQINRKLAFEKYMNDIKPHLFSIKKMMNQSIKQFLSIILIKKEVTFDFDNEDNQDVIKEKVHSIRKMIGMILENLLQVARQQIHRPQLLQSIYYLCRHGNYSCTQPLLTKEELQIMCISTTFKYVSADKHLQKSALLSLIFLKLLIYNTFLFPLKIGVKFTQYEIPNNLYVISSVLYQFCIDYQDQIMLQVDPIYSIGNYEAVDKVRVLESIIIKEGRHREGEVISGLKDQQWVKKNFKFKHWNNERKNLKLLIELLQTSMSKFHAKLVQKYF